MRIGNSPEALPSLGNGARVDGRGAARASGVEEAPAVERPAQPAEVAHAVKRANDSLAQKGAAVEFVIEEDSKRVIVRLVDRETRKLLRQIPNEEMLRIAKFIDEMSTSSVGVNQKV